MGSVAVQIKTALGLTTEGAKAPGATGWYFTLRRKQADGHWTVLLDHGVCAPAADFPATVQRRGGIGIGRPPSWPVGIPELRLADQAPPGLLTPRMVAGDFLRMRAGQAPDGRAQGAAFPSTATREDTGLLVSTVGDFAVAAVPAAEPAP